MILSQMVRITYTIRKIKELGSFYKFDSIPQNGSLIKVAGLFLNDDKAAERKAKTLIKINRLPEGEVIIK